VKLSGESFRRDHYRQSKSTKRGTEKLMMRGETRLIHLLQRKSSYLAFSPCKMACKEKGLGGWVPIISCSRIPHPSLSLFLSLPLTQMANAIKGDSPEMFPFLSMLMFPPSSRFHVTSGFGLPLGFDNKEILHFIRTRPMSYVMITNRTKPLINNYFLWTGTIWFHFLATKSYFTNVLMSSLI